MGGLTNGEGRFPKPQDRLPPRWWYGIPTEWLLNRFSPSGLEDELQGDLLEMYIYWLKTLGVRKANWRYALAVLRVIRPFSWSRTKQSTDYYQPLSILHPDMLRNYLKIAFRNLAKNRTFSTINILGLALGMACSVFILLWVQDERNVDGFHQNDKQLYSVYQRVYLDGKIDGDRAIPGMLGSELKRNIPDIEMESEFAWNRSHTFQVDDKILKFNCNAAEPDFFSMFSFNLVAGTASTALNDPNDLAISLKMAETLFGSAAKAIGKSVRFENRENYQVSAVFEIPINSTMQFDCIRTWKSFVVDNSWLKFLDNNGPSLVVKLNKNAIASNVEAKIKSFLNDRLANQRKGEKRELGLQKFSEVYLHENLTNGQLDGGRINYVWSFGFIGIFILLIACINFMNLSTARAASRAKEIGIRKAIGALKSVLVGQFLSEAFLLSFIASLLALLMVISLLPVFNSLSGKQIANPLWQSQFWYYLVASFVLTGFVAGCYPAFFMASFKPIKVLKGDINFGIKSIVFRKGLVVFQFSISIMMMIGMIVIYKQLNYIQQSNLGFTRENLVYLPIEGDLGKNLKILKDRAISQTSIKEFTVISQIPNDINNVQGEMDWPGRNPNLEIEYTAVGVGYDFVKAMALQLKDGRDFDKKFGSDSLNFLINETALKATGIKNPINYPFKIHELSGKIIGILKDFHFRSLHREINPLVVYLDPNQSQGTALVRLEAGKTKEGIASLEKICKDLNPQFPFSYEFADDNFNRFYRSEQVVGNLVNYFGILAIFISCLGLFGLATFTAEQRTKEIGVRKVLGASVVSIASLLSTDFLKLVFVALVIGSPLAWYGLQAWLQGFAYKIAITWWMFALAGLLAVGIALLTIGYQAIKAALANPVKSLRSE